MHYNFPNQPAYLAVFQTDVLKAYFLHILFQTLNFLLELAIWN